MSGIVTAGLVGAGATVYAANKASKAGKPTTQQRELETLALQNARDARPQGLDFLKRGSSNLDLFDQFYRKLARGDRSTAMRLLSPELRLMDQQNNSAQTAGMMLRPRGGGSAEGRLASRDANIAGRNDAIMGLRTGAIDKLGALGGEMVASGSSLLGQSSSNSLGLLGAVTNRQNSAFEQSRAAGQGLFNLMQMFSPYAQDYFSNRSAANAQRNATGTQMASILRQTRMR